VHGNAPLKPRDRMIMVERIAAGRPVAHAAAEMGVSRKTADQWWRRWQAEGFGGLDDRSSRPHRCPHHTPARVEQRIVRLRQRRKLGPARRGCRKGYRGVVTEPAKPARRTDEDAPEYDRFEE
jgi:transposase-like protein